jgi:TPR repeat protein
MPPAASNAIGRDAFRATFGGDADETTLPPCSGFWYCGAAVFQRLFMTPITPAVITVLIAGVYFGYQALNAHFNAAEAKQAAQKRRDALVAAKDKAAAGDAAAQIVVGLAYHDGAGVSLSFREAYFWLLLAQKGGATEAGGKPIAAAIEASGRMLVDAERGEVQERAAQWRPGPQAADTVKLS